MRYIKLRHELIHARYVEGEGKWYLKIRKTTPSDDGGEDEVEIIEDVADFVLNGTGTLSRWNWPNIQGLGDFKGKIIHSADWEESSGAWRELVKGWTDKSVGVIGVVSTKYLRRSAIHVIAIAGIVWVTDRSCLAASR